MANRFRIKRRNSPGSAGAPASLLGGELAFNENDLVLYYGFGDSGGNATSIITIGGTGAFVALTGAQTIAGVKTFSSTIVGSINGNAATATQLQNARTISLGTDLSGSASFDGSANATINATIANNAVTTAKINNAAVTMVKLDIVSATTFTPVGADSIPGYDLSNTANGRILISDLTTFIGNDTKGQFAATAGAGLTVTSSFTALNYSLNYPGLPAYTTPTGSDILSIYDVGAGAYKKITKSDLTAGLGSGTVTSVGLSMPSDIYAVANTPVTGSATLTVTKVNQAGNTVYAGPNGSTGAPTFRALVVADIPTLTAAKISDFDTQVRTSRLDQMASPTANVSMNSQRLTNLADPVNPQDAATRAYVDAMSQGLDVKASVRAATTTNITLSGTQTVDGVALAVGERVLVKDQTTQSQNGIYVVAAGAWTRATDADTNGKVTAGMFVFVEAGSQNPDSGWVLTTDNPITLNTTALTFTQFSGAGQITAGAGLTKTGNTIDVVGTANRITVNADSIDIASTYVGQTSITTLGTITTGVWNGTAIAVANGGTGATTQAGARTNLGLLSMATQDAANVNITGGAIANVTIDNVILDGGTF